MSRENDSVIFKLLKSADVINDDTQEISQQFDGESYPKLPEASMLELGEVALNIAKDYEVIAIKNNEGEIVYLPFNVAIRLLTLEGDVADLAQYTEESVETLSAATVSIYNNLEEFKVEISNRLVQEITSLSGNVFTTIDSLSATTDAKIAAERERAVSAETALNTALSNLSNHLDDIIPSDTDISNKLTNKGYVDSEIKKITDVIPNDTSSGNPLTNEAFVNSSISTSTATFRGTYNLITDLHLTSAATTSEIAAAVGEVVLVCDKNDYAYVQIPTSETATTEILRIERYKYDGTAWVFEYALNNSGFTAKQWAAINSGIVAGLVVKLEDLPNKAELDALFDAKQDKLTFDNTPRYGSNNPVTSGGIKGAVDERLPLSGGTVTGDLILNIGYGTNVSLKANSNRNFLRFNDSYNGYIIGDGNVRLALETGNVDLKHRYTTSSGATDYVIVDTRNIQENLTPNLKTLNGTPIVGSGDIDIKDVYLAMYRVTPYSSIMEAYWRGKVILVMGFDGIVYFLSKITVSEALFTHFDQTTMTVSSFTVNTSNVYSDITSQQLQENLVSGENIKTINNNSILGSGNIALQVPIDPSNKLDADYVDDTSSLHKFVSTEEKAKWDAKLPLSGGTMTGDLDLNGNALLVRKSGDNARYGIRFITGEGVREGIYVGNPNMRLILEADPNLDLIHKKDDGFYDILDTNNVATKGNIYQTTWGDTLDNIINAANAGKIVILKRDITYNEQKYSPTYVLNCFIKRVSDDYITEAHFYATLEDNVVAEIACKRGPTWVDNGVMQLQENLVSGTNIKTINNQSVLGSGDIDVQPTIDSTHKLDADLVDDTNSTHKFVTANEKESWDNKIDKVTSATTGNFANFDSNGGIVDSGKKDSDFATAAQGSLADSAYQKPLSGIPASDIASGVIPDVSQFVTRSVNDLLNYYTKQNTYTQAEVDALIGSIQHFHYEIYPSLQDITTPATNVLYLIGPTGSGNDKYEEYVYANSDFQKIGDTSIDLSNYVTTQALTSALQQFAQDLQTELNNYALKSQIKTVNGNSLIGSGDVNIHPEIVNLTDGEHSSGFYEDLMRATGVLKLDTPQIFIYTAYNNNHIATTAMCFSTCTNTENPTTNAVIKQTLFLGTFKSVRTLSNTVSGDSYQVVDNWTQILDVKQSDLNAKVSKSGDSMTGNLDMNYHELQVCGNRNGIKFESNATGVLVGNGNMNLTIQNGGGDLKHRKGIAPSAVDYSILDTSNIKTVNGNSIYGSGDIDANDVFWVEYNTTPFADILAAYNAGKVLFANYAGMKFVNTTVGMENDSNIFLFSMSGMDENGEIFIFSFTVTSNNGSTDYTNISDQKLQSHLDSSNKLSADLVDDTSSNNKFVTITFRQF